MVKDFRRLFNEIHPHETLAGDRPIERYLADPDGHPTEPESATASTHQNAQIP